MDEIRAILTSKLCFQSVAKNLPDFIGKTAISFHDWKKKKQQTPVFTKCAAFFFPILIIDYSEMDHWDGQSDRCFLLSHLLTASNLPCPFGSLYPVFHLCL